MVGFPFAVALTTIGALRRGDVATIEYLLPSFWTISPTSVSPTTDTPALAERAPSTAAIDVDVVLVVVVSSDGESSPDESSFAGAACGGLTTATNVDVPGKMC
jgi:hypothetical protein